jgi:uncharacterized protein
LIVVDTTVLVYAVGEDHPLRAPCRALLQAVGDGALRAGTTVEVVQEFAHIRGRRRGRADASSLAAKYVELFSPLLQADEGQLRSGLDLWTEQPSLGCFDAVLAAVALTTDERVIASADAAFGAVPALHHVVPDEAGIAYLLKGRSRG